jgi:hypothetical protein
LDVDLEILLKLKRSTSAAKRDEISSVCCGVMIMAVYTRGKGIIELFPSREADAVDLVDSTVKTT